MASWTLRPMPAVVGLGPALAAEEGVVTRPPHLHQPPHHGGELPSISTSLPLPEIRPEHDGHGLHQTVALAVLAEAAAGAATTMATTATTTATVPDALHDALQAVVRVDLVAAGAAAAVETPVATRSWK